MRFSIVSLGLVATMMMSSSVFADGLAGGVGHTVDRATGGDGNLVNDDSLPNPIGEGDVGSHSLEDIVNGRLPIGLVTDGLPVGHVIDGLPVGHVIDGLPVNFVTSVIPATQDVDNTAKAAVDQTATAGRIVTRSNFLARRKLGHAIHQRRSGDIGSTLDATTGAAMQLKGKIATVAMAEVAKTEQMANGAVKTAANPTEIDEQEGGANDDPNDELSDDETAADLGLDDEVGDDETPGTAGVARRSEKKESEEDEEDEDESNDDEGSSGIARRSEQVANENEIDENENEADENEPEEDENEVDENEADELGDAENDTTGTVARRSEEEEDEDEGDEEEEEEQN